MKANALSIIITVFISITQVQLDRGLPSYSDIKWEGNQMRGDDWRDVVLLVVNSADDGQQRLFNSRLKLCVAPGSDCIANALP